MRRPWPNQLLRSRYAVACCAGLLLACAFPKIGLAGLAWVAPGLMVGAALGKTGWERFRIGYVGGLAFYLASLYWLLLIPYRWHGIPLAPFTGWLALSAFMALFPAAWVWLMAPRRRTGGAEDPDTALPQARPIDVGSALPYGALARNWVVRNLWALAGAAVWVALEMVSARIFGGFPWNQLGASQFELVPLIQVASVTGIYGVSFLVAWVSLALLSAGLLMIRRPRHRSAWAGEVFLPFLAVALLFNFGWWRMSHEPPPAKVIQAALVQPSIPQTLIWDSANDDKRFADLIRLSEAALASSNRTDLLIWPEAGVPKLLRYDKETFEKVTGLARRHGCWIIVGSDDVQPGADAARNPEAMDVYNSSFLIDPEGQLVSRYLKRSLVIFGEYVPLQDTLPFLGFFTPVQGGFKTGTNAVPFRLGNLGVQTSVLICFEDVFPHLARGDVTPEIDFLVNITNDGWFGRSAEQWQHAGTAVFRAVETGVPLVRCCNNGITGLIDSRGRMREIFRDAGGSVYGEGFLRVGIPLAERAERSQTVYTRYGDRFGWTCVALALALLVSRFAGPVTGQRRPRAEAPA